MIACQNSVSEALTPCCTLYNDISQNSIIKYGTAIGASSVGAYCTKSYHSFIASVLPETHTDIQSVSGESVHDRPVSAATDVNLQQTDNFVSKHLQNSLRCIIHQSCTLTSLRMAQLSLSLCTFSRITLIGPSCGSTAPSATPMASNLPEGDRVYQES